MATAEVVNPLTHPTSRLPFSPDTFASPPNEYRGSPFWAWVTAQKKDKTVSQIDIFEQMGMGGFHMHTRVGLDIPYMGEEYMDIVKACVEKAKEKGMMANLYDEDRWPSGFAGGETLRGHPELKGLHLLWTPWPYGSQPYPPSKFPVANAAPRRSELGTLLASYAITLSSGRIASCRILQSGESARVDEQTWYAYVEPNPPSEYMNDTIYPDLLRRDMTERFIDLTHEKYKNHIGKDFGNVAPSMFTDEPQYSPMSTLDSTSKPGEVFIPWTEGLVAAYKEKTGKDLVELLPEIVFDPKGNSPNVPRYQLLDLLCELFTNNYIGVLAEWCNKNNILCTGHMNAEPTLASQTAQTGEVMRTYRSMGLPGIDMLCDGFEFNTAKQAASVSRQYGRGGVMSELYGVTGWQFTFEGHKGQGDWQAALGVTLRVPHLSWSTMRGEAKRDYPACIFYQSPWWKEYKTIEDHFARVNSAMTRGEAVTRVAVVHPIESYWLCFGANDVHGEEKVFRDAAFADLTKWLVKGHVDFDFISESLFPDQTKMSDIKDGRLPVGQCSYDMVILPNLRTIRSTTLERLRSFAHTGGKTIIAGSSPTLVDCTEADTGIQGAVTIPWSKNSILTTVERFRDVDMIVSETTLYRAMGTRADSLVYQLRKDGPERYLFICNTDRDEACPVDITVSGEWQLEVLETLSGKIWPLDASLESGKTLFNWYFDGCESLLLKLSPRRQGEEARRKQRVLRKEFMQVSDVKLESVSLSEPNVLLLDYASFKFGDGKWEGPEEVLRIDQLLRGRLGFFKKGAKFRQPWTLSSDQRKPAGELRLRLDFSSECDISGASLALEDAETTKITLDDQTVASERAGWWVDDDISTVPLPPIKAGKHTIELVYQYAPLTNLERIYILGDFGVRLRGRTAKIVPLYLQETEWGDITRQDLPFYTGNITYHCTFTPPTSDEETVIRAAHFASPCVAVDVDGERAGLLIHQPHALNLGVLPQRTHMIDFTCFGNRYNAFGALHLVPGMTNWLGGDTWRTQYDWWTEEYALLPVGILNCPRVERPGHEVLDLPRRGRKLHS